MGQSQDEIKYGCGLLESSMMDDKCIRCGDEMVHLSFKIYRCQQCGPEEKPEDVM